MKNTYYIGADIGGSHISAALIESASGKIYQDTILEQKVNARGSCAEIIQSWLEIISDLIQKVEKDTIEGIGLAIPGPFDYEEGISHISGVQKFDSLFGLNVRQALSDKILATHKLPIIFINDASAFALGEYYNGAGLNSKKTLISTIGTGFGSTFLVDGIIQQQETDEIPANGYLYNIPFKESMADDYFSTRWFSSAWKEKTGKELSGVLELADLAKEENADALYIWGKFADNLADFIAPWLKKFRPDSWIIGGNIARSAALFLPRLQSSLQADNISGTAIKICKLWDQSPVYGAARYAKLNINDINMNNQLTENYRKTEQFLAAEKAKETQPGNYDIYPAFPVGNGKIQSGSKSLADWIIQHPAVVIDGYVGVFWQKLAAEVGEILARSGKTVRWFHTEAAMKSEEEIDRMIAPSLGEKDSIFGKITDKKLIDWFDTEKLQKIKPDTNADINILIGCGAALAGWNAPLIYVDLPKNELQFRMRAEKANNLGIKTFRDGREMYKRFYFVDWRILDEHKCNVLPNIRLIVDEQRPDNYLIMSGEDLRNGLDKMSRNFFRVRPWFEPGAWGGTWMKEHIEGLNKDVRNLAWSFELMVLENGIMFESDNYRLEVSFDFLMYNNYREVLGDCAERFKYDFPIRFDFLDTFDGGNLSVQCHPRTDYIQKEFGMPFTQDETYYILNCKNEPVVYLGFQEGINPEEFHQTLLHSQDHAQAIDIEKFVQKHPAKKHDFFLIPNGTIHASGKDNLVLEISSAPYIFTFKMYDWVRLDLDGRPRPINIDHGMKNVDFSRQGKRIQEEFISKPSVMKETENCTLEHLPTHPMHFYDVFRYNFDNTIEIHTCNKCHVWMLVEGSSVLVETKDGMKQRFNYAETFVIPANAGSYKITNEGEKNAVMLKSFVK